MAIGKTTSDKQERLKESVTILSTTAFAFVFLAWVMAWQGNQIAKQPNIQPASSWYGSAMRDDASFPIAPAAAASAQADKPRATTADTAQNKNIDSYVGAIAIPVDIPNLGTHTFYGSVQLNSETNGTSRFRMELNGTDILTRVMGLPIKYAYASNTEIPGIISQNRLEASGPFHFSGTIQTPGNIPLPDSLAYLNQNDDGLAAIEATETNGVWTGQITFTLKGKTIHVPWIAERPQP